MRLSKVAQRYLSVASERLFSAAADLYSDQHTQLAPERVETLMFRR